MEYNTYQPNLYQPDFSGYAKAGQQIVSVLPAAGAAIDTAIANKESRESMYSKLNIFVSLFPNKEGLASPPVPNTGEDAKAYEVRIQEYVTTQIAPAIQKLPDKRMAYQLAGIAEKKYAIDSGTITGPAKLAAQQDLEKRIQRLQQGTTTSINQPLSEQAKPATNRVNTMGDFSAPDTLQAPPVSTAPEGLKQTPTLQPSYLSTKPGAQTQEDVMRSGQLPTGVTSAELQQVPSFMGMPTEQQQFTRQMQEKRETRMGEESESKKLYRDAVIKNQNWDNALQSAGSDIHALDILRDGKNKDLVATDKTISELEGQIASGKSQIQWLDPKMQSTQITEAWQKIDDLDGELREAKLNKTKFSNQLGNIDRELARLGKAPKAVSDQPPKAPMISTKPVGSTIKSKSGNTYTF